MSQNVINFPNVPSPNTNVSSSGSHIVYGGGNSGGGGGPVIPWEQTVETRLGDIGQDIRDLRKEIGDFRLWVIGGFAALFLMGLGAVIWANGQLQDHDRKLSDIDTRVQLVQKDVGEMKDDLKDIKADLKSLSARRK